MAFWGRGGGVSFGLIRIKDLIGLGARLKEKGTLGKLKKPCCSDLSVVYQIGRIWEMSHQSRGISQFINLTLFSKFVSWESHRDGSISMHNLDFRQICIECELQIRSWNMLCHIMSSC
ncbi:hypothetical protein CR513_56906, partial [Mucuna pruriens]